MLFKSGLVDAPSIGASPDSKVVEVTCEVWFSGNQVPTHKIPRDSLGGMRR